MSHLQRKKVALCSFHLAECLQITEVRHCDKKKYYYPLNISEDLGRWMAVVSGYNKIAISRLGLQALSQGQSQFLWWPQLDCHFLCNGFYGPLKEIISFGLP